MPLSRSHCTKFFRDLQLSEDPIEMSSKHVACPGELLGADFWAGQWGCSQRGEGIAETQGCQAPAAYQVLSARGM